MERLTQRVKSLGDVWLLENGKTKEMVTESNEYKKYFEKLADYEDAEEKGLILRLPCNIGSEVYIIDNREIVKGKVDGYKWWLSCGFCINVVLDKPVTGSYYYCRDDLAFDKIGKTWFLNRKEAEKKLKEMQKEGADNEQIS